MARDTGWLHKKFVGGAELGAPYMPLARSLLGGLRDQSAGLMSNTRRVVLPDGVVITATFAGAISTVSIDVRGLRGETQRQGERYGFTYTMLGGDLDSGDPITFAGVRVYVLSHDEAGALVVQEAEPDALQNLHVLKTSVGEYSHDEYSQWLTLDNPLEEGGFIGRDDLFASAFNTISSGSVYAPALISSWSDGAGGTRYFIELMNGTAGRHGAPVALLYESYVPDRPPEDVPETYLVGATRNGVLAARLGITGVLNAYTSGVAIHDGRMVLAVWCLASVYGVYEGDVLHRHELRIYLSNEPAGSGLLTSFSLIGAYQMLWVVGGHAPPFGGVLPAPYADSAYLGAQVVFNASGTKATALAYYAWIPGHDPDEWFPQGPGIDPMARLEITISKDDAGVYSADFAVLTDGGVAPGEVVVIADYMGNRQVLYTYENTGDMQAPENTIRRYVDGELVEAWTGAVVSVLDARFDMKAVIPSTDTTLLVGAVGAAASRNTFLALDRVFYTGDVDISGDAYAAGYAVFEGKPQPLQYLNAAMDAYPAAPGHTAPRICPRITVDEHGAVSDGAPGSNKTFPFHGVGLIGLRGTNK